jgi:hypothetical protein
VSHTIATIAGLWVGIIILMMLVHTFIQETIEAHRADKRRAWLAVPGNAEGERAQERAAKTACIQQRGRRQYVSKCATCEPHQHWKMLSWHDASPECKHSVRDHCTCLDCYTPKVVVLA